MSKRQEIPGFEQILSSISVDVDQIRKAARRLEVTPSEAAKMRLIFSALGSIERSLDGLSREIEGLKEERDEFEAALDEVD